MRAGCCSVSCRPSLRRRWSGSEAINSACPGRPEPSPTAAGATRLASGARRRDSDGRPQGPSGLGLVPDLSGWSRHVRPHRTRVTHGAEVPLHRRPGAGDQLNRDKSFSAWMKKLAEAWGQFLDTPASASGIPSFVAQPNYKIGDYFAGPSGWLTFNQFFAREVKPGKRPIEAPFDDKVIVSPADSVFAGTWDID